MPKNWARNLPKFQSQRAAVAVGVLSVALGWYCLHDAWERRGDKPPMWARPLTW